MSDSLWLHEPQHTRPPCPSPAPRVHPNPCPLSRWCHPTVLSSVVPYSSCLQSFPASGSFQMSQFFTLRGQSIGVSASTSVLPMNTQDWSALGWTGWYPCSPRDFQESSPTPSSKEPRGRGIREEGMGRRNAFSFILLSKHGNGGGRWLSKLRILVLNR